MISLCSFKRQGFPCGIYQIDLTYQDDDSRLYVNGNQVFEHIGYGFTQTNIWTGTLDANSTVEFRLGEGAVNASGALTFHYTAPVANFSATPTSAILGSTVTFSDLSTGNITSRLWSFAGGTPSTSTDQNPIVTYNSLGAYDVSLTVTSCGNDFTKTNNGYITVNNPPACANTSLFSQDFQSSSTLANYINASSPDHGQFNAITNSGGSNTITINGNALQFIRASTGTTMSFSRSTNLSTPVPGAIIYKFDLNIANITSNGGTGIYFQVGNNFTTGNATESNPYAQFSIYFQSNSNYYFTIGTNNSSNFASNSVRTITWVMNNTGSTLTYLAPDGSNETVGNDQQDFWVGTTRVFDNSSVQTTNSSISDLKFVWNGYLATVSLDNFLITDPTITIPVVNDPTDLSKCVGEPISVDFTGTASAYLWTNNNTGIGLGASGIGNIPSFIGINPGTSPQVATITVSPSNGTCTGTPQTFTITVNPIPSVNSAATGIICSSVAQNYTITSPVSGTTYTWSRAEVPGISNPEALDQTSNPINESLINTTASPIDVVYIITPSANGCEGSPFTYTVTVNTLPAAGLSSNDADNTICAGDPVTFTATGGISYEFFVDGISQGAPDATSTFTTSSLSNGQAVTVRAIGSNSCFAISDGISTTVNDLPVDRTVVAEASAVCIGNGTNIIVESSFPTTTYQLRIDDSPVGGAVTGDGGAILLPTGALVSATTFNVLATVTATGCTAQMSATQMVTVHEVPTASSGGNQTICENGTATVNDATATNFESILWTHNGSGTLSGASTLTPTYTPVAGDAGHDVTLTLTASNNGCTPATAFYTVHVDALPTAVAGGSETVCPGGAITVIGTSASNGTILWTKGDGQGILSDETTLNPTYTVSVLDVGTITLTMTVTSNNSCSPQTATATYTLSVTPTTAEAGPDLSTCSGTGPVDITPGSGSENSAVTAWSTSGTGFFSDPNSLTDCTYTPSAADIASGSVTITLTAFAFSPCTNAIDTKTLTIHPSPTAVAGTDLTICSNSGAVNITAGASATGYSSIQWSSSGTGTFTNENSVTTCTYAPSASDISAGSVELTLTAYANLPCSDVTSSKTLTITTAPTAEAGTAVTTCSNSAPVNITAGTTASNANGISWSSSGTGSFANGNSLTLCTYQPSTADKTAGSVTLTLTVTGNPPCSSAVSSKTLTITPAPTAVAGPAMAICYAGGEVNITAGSSATHYSSVLWTTSGTGTFTNDNSLTLAAYTPSAADIFAGDVILTLTAYGNSPCSGIVSTKTLSITPAPTANAGADIYTCSGSGAVNITAGSNASNYTTVTWSSDGSGTFTNVAFTDSLYLFAKCSRYYCWQRFTYFNRF